ncbi:hypothetical protein KM043_004806 [Ampulex compressa]|nr:hypothetical protein KM043_004806 [Ampulex compressa]
MGRFRDLTVVFGKRRPLDIGRSYSLIGSKGFLRLCESSVPRSTDRRAVGASFAVKKRRRCERASGYLRDARREERGRARKFTDDAAYRPNERLKYSGEKRGSSRGRGLSAEGWARG